MQQTEGEDCAWCGGDGFVTGSMACPECTPTPRAVVAISEDRQWLVVFGVPYRKLWGVYLFDSAGAGADFIKEIDDYGQDAHDVLATFLRERDG